MSHILRYQAQDLDFIKKMRIQAQLIGNDSTIQQVVVLREDFLKLVASLPQLPEFKK